MAGIRKPSALAAISTRSTTTILALRQIRCLSSTAYKLRAQSLDMFPEEISEGAHVRHGFHVLANDQPEFGIELCDRWQTAHEIRIGVSDQTRQRRRGSELQRIASNYQPIGSAQPFRGKRGRRMRKGDG